MKIFANYKYFQRVDAEKLIRNESNNDHWPTANNYLDTLKEWLIEIDKQQAVIKDYLQYLTTIKVGSESFVIRIVNDINTKLKALNAKDKQGNYFLERTEQIKNEIKNLRVALDFPEYPAFREQLKTWNDDPNASLQRIRTIFANYQLGQWETIYDHFIAWNEAREYPINEITELLTAWKENNEKVDSEFKDIEQIKSLTIQLLERKGNFIRFIWRVPLQPLEDNPQQKNRTFPNISNYLFYLNGEYYEVKSDDWKQTGWETAEIVAKKSMFYNGYWWLITAGASGWIHHSPISARDEVCNCQPYDYFDTRQIFFCDYELKFHLWRIGKSEAKLNQTIPDPELNAIASGLPRKVENLNDELKKIENEVEHIFGIPTGIPKKLIGGTEGVLYMLLGQNLSNKSVFIGQTIPCQWKRVGKWNESAKVSDLTEETHQQFLEEAKLKDEKMFHCLTQHIKATIYWRNKPIWDGNYYVLHNQLRITESISPSGTCVTIEASDLILAQITEFVTSKVGGDKQTDSFLSGLITVATGVAAAYFAPAAIPALGKGATVVAKAAHATAKASRSIKAAAISASIGAAGSMAGTALNHSLSYSSTETKESMSIHEFKHKYLSSKARPLNMRLEWNQQSFNQYANNRELFGVYRNDTFNEKNLGSLLNTEGFCKLIINSWRVVGNDYSEWFREKLEAGVFLEKTYGSTKNIKLSKGVIATSQGGIVRGSWKEITVTNTVSVGSGWDDISHLGRGFWVYKQSPRYTNMWGNKDNGIWVIGGSYDKTNLLSWLINYLNSQFSGFVVEEESGKWILKHPEPSFSNHQVDIPDQYKNKTLEDGQKAVKIHYLLDFFSGGHQSDPGDEINATHFLVSKLASGTQSKLTIEIKGHHVLVNDVSDPSGIPPAGTLPVNPLSGSAQAPNPLNISGTVPPGSQAPISIVPASSGGLTETQINIQDDTETQQPPEIGVQEEVIIDPEVEAKKQYHQDVHEDPEVQSTPQDDGSDDTEKN